MNPKVNVLFTSAGRRVELLRAFATAYRTLQCEGNIIALDIDPLAPALQIADKAYIVPRLTESNYLPTLLEICRREEVNIIFPLIDPDVPVLARYREQIEATGARLAVVSAQAAGICGDKWLTKKFFQDLGLATARAWLPNEINPATAEYPLFVKPRGGSAATNTFKVRNAGELAFFIDYVPDPIIEQFLSGAEITNDLICDLEGEVLAVISRRRIEVRWGEVAKGVTVFDPVITKACLAIAKALPAVGPVTIQCILHDGQSHFTEINARLGGGIPLGIAAGVDSPQWLLARLAGIPSKIPPLGTYQTDLYMTRYDDSFFLSDAKRQEMAGHSL
jgi:carbamoyl-phosphate synthase large subunit